ncbi:TPA: Ig-like domain-containing protein [Aeromonas veronii]|nr:Ig-like domain-containing protein [Aeromonas veronii]
MKSSLSTCKVSVCALFLSTIIGCHSDDVQIAEPPETEKPTPVTLLTYTAVTSEFGSSDASGAVALDDQFMIVADDEVNALRVYPRQGLTLSSEITLSMVKEWDFREQSGLSKELDIEALSWYAPGKLLLVGSHSNKKDGGEAVTDRGHIVAVSVTGSGAETEFEYIGKYSQLEQDLIQWDNDNGHGKGAGFLGFSRSAGAGIAPENIHGFSIEGATINHNGDTLLLGFRAPQLDQRSRNKALIVPVTNYLQLIDGSAASAEFGEPVELNLAGRGIRDISRWQDHYLIVSGPAGASVAEVPDNFALYRWQGGDAQPVQLDHALEQLRSVSKGSIETLVQPLSEQTLNAGSQIQLLLDNGDTVWPGQSAVSKDLPASEQKFQGAFMTLGQVVVDQQAPTLLKQFPVDQTVGVNTDTRFELSFDEGITLGDGALAIYQGDKLISRYTKESPGVSVVFNRLVIRPSQPLDYSKFYSMRLEGALVTDNAGNVFTGEQLGMFVTAGEPTRLDAGDIQFVAGNAEAPDAIAFMLMKRINGGTRITFTDRDYYAAKGAFWHRKNDAPALNEGVFTWTADRNLNAGDIITIQTDTALSPIADIGQVIGSPSGLGKEETIYAMVNTEIRDLEDGVAGEITSAGSFLAALTLGGQNGSDIPAEISNHHLSFVPENGKADQTNALFDVMNCGRSHEDVNLNLKNASCWHVTFKSEGAFGFPLYTNGSLFEQPEI